MDERLIRYGNYLVNEILIQEVCKRGPSPSPYHDAKREQAESHLRVFLRLCPEVRNGLNIESKSRERILKRV